MKSIWTRRCTLILLLPLTGWTQEMPVTVTQPEGKAWVGQRVPFYVVVRAPGSFAGTVNFDLPELPGTLLMKIGNPVVGSEEREGQSWFIQTHEFALFSQKDGALEVPAFRVRYAYRKDFTGPEQAAEAQVPAWTVEIERPPGSEQIGFLITTESLDVSETWDPQPGPAAVGTVFKRTIIQRADQVSGMALAPAPANAPDGIRVYTGDAETEDKLERGNFLGERRETMTYLLQKPGDLSIPALTYVWWNPKKEILESKTLPSVTIAVAPAPASSTPDVVSAKNYGPWLIVVMLAGLLAWRRKQVTMWGKRYWRKLNPPENVAAHRLHQACRGNDAAAAAAAWTAWRNTQPADFRMGSELQDTLLELRRVRYGPDSAKSWDGARFALAFKNLHIARKPGYGRNSASMLPSLNDSQQMPGLGR